MPYKKIIAVSEGILGDSPTPFFERKVFLIMYYSELLALSIPDIENVFTKVGREKIFKIFYLDSKFTEYIYCLFLKHEMKTIMQITFDRLIKIQELIHYVRSFNSEQAPRIKQ